MKAIRQDLQAYIEREIRPRYDSFDAAHRRDHVEMVIRQSLELAKQTSADTEMAYVIAAYHDTGLCEGREQHHLVSGKIIRADRKLRQWFSSEQIETMACAAEDHRASADHAPHTLYGRIVAEADRFIDPETIVRRTVQSGMEHYPELDKDGHYERTVQHLHEKYGRNGYLKLWFADSHNARRLEILRLMIDDEQQIRRIFEQYWETINDTVHIAHYNSPIGNITLASNGESLIGLWFDGQQHFTDTIAGKPCKENPKLSVLVETRRWLDLYFSGKEPDFTPPLAPQGTPFRQKVWKELLNIPYGKTLTYGTIAQRVVGTQNFASQQSSCTSPRAVCGAVGRNPISIIIPCHRVIGADGSLTGYAGGLERKVQLLRLEGVSVSDHNL